MLLSERERFALNGRVYVALAPLLDGSHSAGELVETLAGEHSPAVIHLALMRLQEPGYVVEAGAVNERPLHAKNPPPLPESAGPPITVAVSSLRDVIALGLPGSWARRLARTAPRAAAHAPPRTGLTVCLVDDYLRPELAVTAAARLKQGENLFFVRPVGRWLWLGPLLLQGPASEALWQLFCERMRMNRSADVTALERGASFPLFPDDRSPATVQLAISIAGGLVSRVMEGRPPSGLTNGILTYDTLEGTFAHHPVERIPPARREVSPGVGDTTAPIQRHGPSAGLSHYGDRACSSLETLARMERFVSPITGIISTLQPVPSVGGMHVFAAVHPQAPAATRRKGSTLGRKGGAAGTGASEEQARAGCIGEAIERYSGGFFGDEGRRRARLAEIAEIAFHPEDLLLFSDAQYAARHATREGPAVELVPARFDSSQAIEWVPVSSLITGEARWVPAAYCYYGHGPSSADGYRGEPFCFADSNGCASGNTPEEAMLHGLLELFERDACALAWYNRIRRPEIDLESFEDERFQRVREDYSRRGRELHVLDVRTDTAVAAVLAVAWNGADGLATRFGLGCHLNPRIAVSRSLSELAQLEAEASIAGAEPRFEPFASLSIHVQQHLIPSSQPPVPAGDLPDFTKSDLAEELHWCCSMLAGLGHDVLVLDQTRPEVGFPTVRVIVPGLRHFWRRLAPGRLYDVPVALGWIEAPLREDELNPLSVLI